MFKKILVPLDGSETAWKALDQAIVLGGKFESDLLIVNVMEQYHNPVSLTSPWDNATLYRVNTALEKVGEKVLDMAKEKLANYAKNVEYTLEEGHPSERIVSLAKDSGCDAIVIGSRGLSGIADFFLGSVSYGVVQHATVPVLIVK